MSIKDSFEPSHITTFGTESESALKYIEQMRYSNLDRIGYTPEQIDMYTGKVMVKTTWVPHPQKGTPVEGTHKLWSPCEWWCYNEWHRDGRGIVLSENQQKMAQRWHDIDLLEIHVSGGRGSGKSWEGAILSLWSMTFLNEIFSGYKVSLFAGAKSQTGTVYDEHVIPLIAKSNNIHKLVSDYDPMWDVVTNRKKTEVKEVKLKFLTGATMYVNSTSTKSARSKHPDQLWLDEVVEAEDVSGGRVISSAVSSLTAGHHMRLLATSTVHKHSNGWFAKRIRRAKRMMAQGRKHIIYVNLSEGGLGSKTWVSLADHKKELSLKMGDDTIDIAAEFGGEIIGQEGNAFHPEDLRRCILNSKPPVFDPNQYHIAGHDPGFGSSYYGLVILQTDLLKAEVLYSSFWYRTSPTKIFDQQDGILDISERFKVDFHSVDAAASSTIKMLQDYNFDVQGYAFREKPRNLASMTMEEQERFNTDQKHIGVNHINEMLAFDRFSLYPNTGAYKKYDQGVDDEPVYANQILREQMESYRVDPDTGRFIKGGDDMVDALNFSILPIAFGDFIGGMVLKAGQV